MDLDRIYAMVKQVKKQLHCSQQSAEYIASLMALEHSVTKDSFVLLAEIEAIHSYTNPCCLD